jgi:undecaprenyl-diphosphatase
MGKISKYVSRGDELVVKYMDRYHDNKALKTIMLVFTAVGSTAFGMIFTMIMLYYEIGIGIALCTNLVLSQVVIQSVKRIINRQRPYSRFKELSPIRPPKCIYSLPSGHTGSAFSIALVLSDFLPQYSALFFTAAALVGFSRIFLVNHYPSDVIAGITISTLIYNLVPFN